MRPRLTTTLAISLILAVAAAPATAAAAGPPRPAILFCSPEGLAGGWLDLDYASELHRQGFEVDYTNSLADITWDRIRQYNVLVIYVTPDAFDVTMRGQKSSPEKVRGFAELTHVVAGHPVVAGPEGKELFLQVTKVGQAPDRWHVSVNNPTDRPITTTLTKTIPLPGLELPETKIALSPGQYVVVR